MLISCAKNEANQTQFITKKARNYEPKQILDMHACVKFMHKDATVYNLKFQIQVFQELLKYDKKNKLWLSNKKKTWNICE